MKKYIWLMVLVGLLMIPVLSIAEDSYKYSGAKTADAIISNTPGRFRGLIVIADGTTGCSVSIHDSLTNAGAKIVPTFTVAAGEKTGGGLWPFPVSVNTAIFADMTTTGTCEYEVYYQ